MSTRTGPGAASLTPIVDDSTPVNSAAVMVASEGFIEQEFAFGGQAGRYRFADHFAPAEQVDGGHAFVTRLLVRRPVDPVRFSGTVVVEWLNVSAGQDLDFVFGASRELIFRAGHAWVGVSAQRVGVERLATDRPQRYRGLTVAAPNADPRDGQPLDAPDPFTNAPGGDVLCWDIFTQVAEALRRGDGALLGGARVQCLIAAGESQSAARLSRYFNCIQPQFGSYDGFLLYDRAGPHALRADVPAKVLTVGTDFFSVYAGGSPAEDADNQRWWDLAGASHVSLSEMAAYIDPQVLRDGLQRIDGQPASLTQVLMHAHPDAPRPLWSRVPNGDLVKAGLHALVRWVLRDVPPASAPRLVLNGKRLARDEAGCTLGGIRYAAYEVPTARNIGVTEEPPVLAGCHLDFDAMEMARRYGHPDEYVNRVAAAVELNLRQGFLLKEDAARVMEEARAVTFAS